MSFNNGGATTVAQAAEAAEVEFIGWAYMNEDGTAGANLSADTFTKFPAGTTKLVAKWQSTAARTITFNTFVDGTSIDDITIERSDDGYVVPADKRDLTQAPYVLADSLKPGYTFDGWRTSNGFAGGLWNGEWGEPLEGNRLPETITENLQLFAKWSPNASTITFDANFEGAEDGDDVVWNGWTGWTPAQVTENATDGTDYSALPDMADVRAGWKLTENNSWNTAADGSGTTITMDNIGTFPASGNVTYYAQWTAMPSKITFSDAKFNHGSEWTGVTDQVLPGGSYTTLPEASENGWVFDGWFAADGDADGAEGWGQKVALGATPDEGAEEGVLYLSAFPAGEDTTFYAKWTTDESEIKFNANYEGAAAVSSWNGFTGQTMTEADPSYTALPTLSRTGYDFLGWFDAATDGNAMTYDTIGDGGKFPAGGAEYFAHWSPKTVTVQFYNGYGDDFDMDAGNYGTLVDTWTGDVGHPFEDGKGGAWPAVTRDGEYALSGWQNVNTGTVYKIADAFPLDTVPATDDATVNFVAKWMSTAVNTVTFDTNLNGGTLAEGVQAPESFDVEANTVVNPDEHEWPTWPVKPAEGSDELRTGYDFLGWFGNAEGTGEASTAFPTEALTDDVTYYAKWEALPASIVWDANRDGVTDPATWDGTTDKTFADAGETGLPTFAEGTVPGYEFAGWFTKNGDELGEDEQPTGNWGEQWMFGDAPEGGAEAGKVYMNAFPAGTTTLYAKWQPLDVEYVFDANYEGGTNPASWTGKTDATVTQQAMPTFAAGTRAGYAFDGWFTDAACIDGNEAVKPATYQWNSASVSDEGKKSTTTFYAKWIQLNVEYVFTTNWAAGELGEEVVVLGKTDAAASDAVSGTWPTWTAGESNGRAGYTFDGWFTKNGSAGEGGTPDWGEAFTMPSTFEWAGGSVSEDGETSTHAAFARWTANESKIAFDTNLAAGPGEGTAVPQPETWTGVTDQTFADAGHTELPLMGENEEYNDYKVVGWYTADGTAGEGGTPVWGEALSIDGAFPANDSDDHTKTYYAKWASTKSNTFTFNVNLPEGASLNDGVTAPSVVAINPGDTAAGETWPDWAETPEALVNGYRFDGWFATATPGEGDEAVTGFPEGVITESAEYWAKWTPLTASIAWNANYPSADPAVVATWTGVTNQVLTDADESYVADSMPVPTRAGWIFKGWYADTACTDGNEVTAANLPEKFAAGTTNYYAKWEADGSTIVFVANYDGEGSTSDDDITWTGKTDQTPAEAGYSEMPGEADMKRDGYTFAGWYTDAACTDGNEASMPAAFAAEPIYFYAKPTAKPASITWDAEPAGLRGFGAPARRLDRRYRPGAFGAWLQRVAHQPGCTFVGAGGVRRLDVRRRRGRQARRSRAARRPVPERLPGWRDDAVCAVEVHQRDDHKLRRQGRPRCRRLARPESS